MNEWTRVVDRLPDCSAKGFKRVLMCRISDKAIISGKFNTVTKKFMNEDFQEFNATHWMSLPEPPSA